MGSKALFLDRDGVVNVEKNYLYRPQEVEWVDGIMDVCRCYAQRGYRIIIITNQSGIARGYYSEEDFAHLSRWMIAQFAHEGIVLDHIYHCPHHESIDGECACRKPAPGLFFQAREAYDIDMEHSIMIGDNERDITAAHRAGVGYTIVLGRPTHTRADRIITSLRELLPC